MKIEVLIAIQSKGKKDISAILSSMSIDSDARIAIYHYNGAKEEELDYKGNTICVHYTAVGTKMAAYNELLRLTDADVILFADPTQRFVSSYGDQIVSAFAAHPKCDGILFGAKKDGKRVGVGEVRRRSFSSLCIKVSVLRERGMAFLGAYDEAYNTGIVDVFRHEFVAWPSRCVGKSEKLFARDVSVEDDEANCAFYDSHRLGIMWWAASLVRIRQLDKKSHKSVRALIKGAWLGHHVYLFKGYDDENKPIKENPFPFVVSVISMLGFSVQLILSLLIVFTEVQYIPIWVSLIFLILFAMIYVFASPKVRNAKAILASGVILASVSFFGSLITYLQMGVSWTMSLYGAFICLIAVFGLMFCLTTPGYKRCSSTFSAEHAETHLITKTRM